MVYFRFDIEGIYPDTKAGTKARNKFICAFMRKLKYGSEIFNRFLALYKKIKESHPNFAQWFFLTYFHEVYYILKHNSENPCEITVMEELSRLSVDSDNFSSFFGRYTEQVIANAVLHQVDPNFSYRSINKTSEDGIPYYD
jgi:hypothetical protein